MTAEIHPLRPINSRRRESFATQTNKAREAYHIAPIELLSLVGECFEGVGISGGGYWAERFVDELARRGCEIVRKTGGGA